MTLIDVENMTAADLKAKRDDVAATAKSADHAELADRYCKARLDAKLRDEKLGEQGVLITQLELRIKTLTDQVDVLQSAYKNLEAAYNALLAEKAKP